MNRGGTSRVSERGFIALTSAVLISGVLMSLAASVSSAAFFSRFNALSSEFKRVSLSLAESCAHIALLEIAQDYDWAVTTENSEVWLGEEKCTLVSSHTQTSHGSRIFTVTMRAEFRNTFSVLIIQAKARDPSIVSPVYSPAVEIVSWREVVTVP
ncbi:MAG TPA: hypothetical protein VD928_00930 [Candidatus Paceibacterota bacterium]|nr:hypothetical protein [Candidatus Paceibacterota bacterium]